MNQFLLTFKDPKIEASYQITNQQQKRKTTFIALSFGFIVAFVVKVFQSVGEKNMNALYLNAFMLGYLLISLGVVYKTNKYLRFAIVLLNHIVTIYFIAFEDRKSVDNQMAMLQGVNQMAATYLLVLTGEYLDGMITIFLLQIFRIFWGALQSNGIQFSALITSTLLIVYINYFNYQYNKAKRSQYLLTLVDLRWEEILNNLNQGQSYLILQFDEGKLQYQIRDEKHCQKVLDGADNFMKFASINNQPLENYIYQKIRQYIKTASPSFNEDVLINYQKRTIRAEISIYQGNTPTILFIFRNFFYEKKIDLKLMQKQYEQIIHLLVQVVKNVNPTPQFQLKYQPLQRKLILAYLIFNIKKNIKIKTIDLESTIKQISKLYGNVKIYVSSQYHGEVVTPIHILQIMLIQIFENTRSSEMLIGISMKNEQIECKFNGFFDIGRFNLAMKYFKPTFSYLFSKTNLTQTTLIFLMQKCIDQPFHNI